MSGIEIEQNSKQQNDDEIVAQIMNAFNTIKSKIDYIANKRIDEYKRIKMEVVVNNQINLKGLLARYRQFKGE